MDNDPQYGRIETTEIVDDSKTNTSVDIFVAGSLSVRKLRRTERIRTDKSDIETVLNWYNDIINDPTKTDCKMFFEKSTIGEQKNSYELVVEYESVVL